MSPCAASLPSKVPPPPPEAVSFHCPTCASSVLTRARSAFPGLKVNYEFVKYDFFPNSSYIGEPGPENEKAWHDLMDSMGIRVTAEELAVHNQQSVPLPNGGYLAWLGVFHELHCVKLLRHWSWRDYYPEFANMTAFEQAHNMVHIDHCIEILRSSALCRADTEALSVFKWNEKSPKPIFDTKRVDHRCVNWDSLMSSSYVDRVVTKEEMDSLVNPLLDSDTAP